MHAKDKQRVLSSCVAHWFSNPLCRPSLVGIKGLRQMKFHVPHPMPPFLLFPPKNYLTRPLATSPMIQNWNSFRSCLLIPEKGGNEMSHLIVIHWGDFFSLLSFWAISIWDCNTQQSSQCWHIFDRLASEDFPSPESLLCSWPFLPLVSLDITFPHSVFSPKMRRDLNFSL